MFSKKRQGGFTVIELLTVIAIIGILAALIFPIAGSARRKAKQTQCISNMKGVFTAVKQFQLDNARYPDFIAGPAQYDGSGNLLPLDETTGMDGVGMAVSLYPEYIDSPQGLNCPVSDLNYDEIEYSMTDIVEDPMFGLTHDPKNGMRAVGVDGAAYGLYLYSSYDVQVPRTTASGNREVQAHYAPTRIDMTATGAMGDQDVERQLRWRTPPADTVITWCSYHRGTNMDDGGNKDVVLFLDGTTKLMPSAPLEPWEQGWRVEPR